MPTWDSSSVRRVKEGNRVRERYTEDFIYIYNVLFILKWEKEEKREKGSSKRTGREWESKQEMNKWKQKERKKWWRDEEKEGGGKEVDWINKVCTLDLYTES